MPEYTHILAHVLRNPLHFDLALDSANRPRIAYRLSPSGTSPKLVETLYQERNDGDVWTSTSLRVFEDPFPNALPPSRVDLALDGFERPHVTFAEKGEVQHMVRSGTIWSAPTPIPGSDSESEFRLRIFPPDIPRLFCNHGNEVVYAQAIGNVWSSFQSIGSTSVTFPSMMDIATRPDDTFEVAYQAAAEAEVTTYVLVLKYNRFSSKYVEQFVSSGLTDPQLPSLAMDSGRPSVSTYDLSAKLLWRMQMRDPGDLMMSWMGVSLPVDTTGTLVEHSMGRRDRGEFAASYYDPINHDLRMADMRGSIPDSTMVDSNLDSGRQNVLVMDDRKRHVVYWEGTEHHIRVAYFYDDIRLWDTYTNLGNGTPALDELSGHPSADHDAATDDLLICYYEHRSVGGRPWFARFHDGTFTNEEIPVTGPGDFGRHSAVVRNRERVWFTRDNGGQSSIWVAERTAPNTWITSETLTGSRPILALRYSDGYVAWLEQGVAPGIATVQMAREDGLGLHDQQFIYGLAAPTEDNLAFAVDNAANFSVLSSFSGVVYLRGATPLFATTNAHQSTTRESINVTLTLDDILKIICDEIIKDFFQEGFGPSNSGSGGETARKTLPRRAGAKVAAMPSMPMLPPIDPALANQSPLSIPDNLVMSYWMQLFDAHPGGRFYLNAMTSHALELKSIFETHAELRHRGRRLMVEFFPALALLITGRGEQFVLSQSLIARARDMWQGIAAVASPELAAFINGELARFHNLDDFVNTNMNQWVLALGVDTGGILATGTVHISELPTSGTWVLTRPDNRVTSGSGGVLLTAQPVGHYRIEWLPLVGYVNPAQPVLEGNLAEANTLAFFNHYRTQRTLDIINYLLGLSIDDMGLDANGDGKVDIGDLVWQTTRFE